jgi:hypothetical protein
MAYDDETISRIYDRTRGLLPPLRAQGLLHQLRPPGSPRRLGSGARPAPV